MQQHRNGFTIVELLIVIVVIAILAAISIVAFTGIQERARLSSALSYAAQIKRSPEILKATAIYTFDDCTTGSSSVIDSSEAKNNGTVVGTTSCSNDTPSGSGKSFSFNGSTLINTAAELGASSYLKAAWVKINTCPSSPNIISTTVSNSGAVLYNCASLQAGHNGTWNSANSGINIADNKWHHIVTTYEGGTLTLFIDGKQVARGAAAVPTSLTNTVGGYAGSNYFNGLMDDVLIIAS